MKVLLVGVICHFSTEIGFAHKFPPHYISALWPTTAILFALLVATPVRHWWAYIMAAYVPSVIKDAQAGFPVSALPFIVAGILEIVVAAAGVRRFAEGARAFSSLRSLVAYVLVAVILAPFLSAIVAAFAGPAEAYWFYWRVWFLSEALAYLMLAPAILTWTWIAGARAPRGKASPGRWIEACLMGGGVVAVSVSVFVWATAGESSIPALVYLPLPLLLWAAVRFGPAGVNTALLVVACLAISGAVHGRGPFAFSATVDHVLSLQLFLATMSIPLIFLATLMEERRRAEERVAERLRFETLLSDLSVMLSAATPAEIDRQIEGALRRIVEDLAVDLAWIFALPDRSDEVRLTHSWSRAGVPPLPAVIREREAPATFSRLRQGDVVRLSQSEDRSGEFLIDRQSLARFGTRSTAMVPLIAGATVLGSLSVGTARAERRWPDELIPRLRLLADVFAHALARQQAERTASERTTQIQTLAGQLISAQEEERRRIARELHDGVNQKVTALSIALATLGGRAPSSPADLGRELARLQERAAGVVEDIRQLSHGLHPGVLEHVGLVAALEGYCREFEDTHGAGVTFRADPGLGVVPVDLALCLYRATQEALGNVAKHAKARHVRVSVARDAGDVVLAVADDGCGFDPMEASGRRGLGLVSLEERIRLFDGQIAIDTGPQRGTEVRIVVPLREGLDAPGDGPGR